MECNKDEAARAKEIAEKKFLAKDIFGAKKFALKAQSLYPGLEGVSQMVATFNVYVSVENKVNGEADWYSILGVDPRADDETLRKQYRKLALLLHPDKNKSVGANGAFKYISEAWSFLSDKAKRAAYDSRMKSVRAYQKASVSRGASSANTQKSNGFSNFAKAGSTTNVKTPKSNEPRAAGHSTTPASSHKPRPNTFWTLCLKCMMQYEYVRLYLNCNLLCPNCREPFLAEEIPSPCSSRNWNFNQQKETLNQEAATKNTTTPEKNAGVSHTSDSCAGPSWTFSSTSSAVHAASVVQQAYEKVKKERQEARAAARREEALRRKNARKMSGLSSAGGATKRRRVAEDVKFSSHRSNVNDQMGSGTEGCRMGNLYGSKHGSSETGGINGTASKPDIRKDVHKIDIKSLLIMKAKNTISKKLKYMNSAAGAKAAAREQGDSNEKVNVKGDISLASSEALNENRSGEGTEEKNDPCNTNSVSGISAINKNSEVLERLVIDVPDSDFHDFDKDRTERSFGDNQVWAAYDDDDGMPRYYALIHNVMSFNPFKIRISWLNSKTNNELGPLNWVGSGFSKTCGDFRVGKHETCKSLHAFSHMVSWSKVKGVIQIYPRKGDIWALYRNWSPDWNELTADEVIHKYDMVEVLEDYNEDSGVLVVPLVKVTGFRTVFQQHLDPSEIRRIPREEMFRFSHQVPSCVLTGQEAPNAPKGCRELDPAATPSELLQGIGDAKEAGFEEEERADEGNSKIDMETAKTDKNLGDADLVNVVDETEETAKDDTLEPADRNPS